MKKKNFYNEGNANDIQSGGVYEEKLSFILKEVGSNKKILDIGCSDGYIGEKLIEQKNVVYGADLDKRNLLIAKKRGLLVECIDIEVDSLPYKRNMFDVVIIGDIIEHVFDTDELLRKCFGVLKKGGKLIVTTPNVASLGRRMMLLFGISPFLEYSIELSTNGLPSVGHIRYFTKSTLEKQLAHIGYRDILVQGNSIHLVLFKSILLGKIFPSFCTMLMSVCYK